MDFGKAVYIFSLGAVVLVVEESEGTFILLFKEKDAVQSKIGYC